jgi:hypothetical protein
LSFRLSPELSPDRRDAVDDYLDDAHILAGSFASGRNGA